MGAYVRTYVRPAELDGNNYRAAFSPHDLPRTDHLHINHGPG